MAWTTPVIDRTETDVDRILSLNYRIVTNGYDSLSVAEKAEWSASTNKGALNVADLQRIDANIVYLHDLLVTQGYPCTIDTSNPTWTTEMIPLLSHIDRIRDNVNALLTAYYTYAGSPTIDYSVLIDWDDVNDIEHNIFNINLTIEQMIANFIRYSGTFYSGEGIIL